MNNIRPPICTFANGSPKATIETDVERTYFLIDIPCHPEFVTGKLSVEQIDVKGGVKSGVKEPNVTKDVTKMSQRCHQRCHQRTY